MAFTDALYMPTATMLSIVPHVHEIMKFVNVMECTLNIRSKLLGLATTDAANGMMDQLTVDAGVRLASILNPFQAEDVSAPALLDAGQQRKASAGEDAPLPAVTFDPIKATVCTLGLELPTAVQVGSKLLVRNAFTPLFAEGEKAEEAITTIALETYQSYRQQLAATEDPPDGLLTTMNCCKGILTFLKIDDDTANFEDVMLLTSDRMSGKESMHADLGVAICQSIFFVARLDAFTAKIPEYRSQHPKLKQALQKLTLLRAQQLCFLKTFKAVVGTISSFKCTLPDGCARRLESLAFEKYREHIQVLKAMPEETIAAAAASGEFNLEALSEFADHCHGLWPDMKEMQEAQAWVAERKHHMKNSSKIAGLMAVIKGVVVNLADIQERTAYQLALSSCNGIVVHTEDEIRALVALVETSLAATAQAYDENSSGIVELLSQTCALLPEAAQDRCVVWMVNAIRHVCELDAAVQKLTGLAITKRSLCSLMQLSVLKIAFVPMRL